MLHLDGTSRPFLGHFQVILSPLGGGSVHMSKVCLDFPFSERDGERKEESRDGGR